MTNPLNLRLYEALRNRFSKIRICNPRQERRTQYMPDPAQPTRCRANVMQRGEQYAVDCPFCDDSRQRLYVSYMFGQFDAVLQSCNWALWYCHNEHCHERPANRDLFRAMTTLPFGHHIPAPPSLGADVDPIQPVNQPPAASCELPIHELLTALPDDHPAARYVRERDFDPRELVEIWQAGYVSPWSPVASNRLLIPIRRPTSQFTAQDAAEETVQQTVLAGWQARWIGEPEPGTPKYLFPSGFRKTDLLYGLIEAKSVSGPVIVCEGVTDVWQIGPGGVALFGKHLSLTQKLLLVHHFADRPLVVLFDADAKQAAYEIVRELQAARALREGDRRVLSATLPPGRQDPADCTRDEVHAAVAAALAAAGTNDPNLVHGGNDAGR